MFDNTHSFLTTHSTCYTVLQCTTLSSITITIQTHTSDYVCTYATACRERERERERHKKKELIFGVYCICVHTRTYASKEVKSSHCAMIYRLSKYYYKTVKVLCVSYARLIMLINLGSLAYQKVNFDRNIT